MFHSVNATFMRETRPTFSHFNSLGYTLLLLSAAFPVLFFQAIQFCSEFLSAD